jgi:hypothetical protein
MHINEVRGASGVLWQGLQSLRPTDRVTCFCARSVMQAGHEDALG